MGDRRIRYAYDAMGRRVRTSVDLRENGVWREESDTHYTYWDWNVIEEHRALASAPSETRRYVWGEDLSDSFQGAGGVGGLLAQEYGGTRWFYHYDGNGNVTELTDNSGTTVASYRYTAFGQLRSSSGPAADENDYGFSTKPYDAVSECYYYGYRYYDPLSGRWLNRDPIGEQGGVNVYGFVTNSPLDFWDYLGKQKPRTRDGNNPNNLPLQFSIGTSLRVGGCFNAGPFILCATGGYSISKGKCCDSSSGEEKDVVELTGSISASTGVGISTGFTYSFDPIGQLSTIGTCPSQSIDSVWDAVTGSFDVNAQLGPVAGGCSWSGPLSGWHCSAGIDFSLGANITVGGTLKVSGKFIE